VNAQMQPSHALQVTVAGLVMAGAGIFVQVASGSTLYPSVLAPVVLLGSAALVAVGPRRWAPYVGLGVALVLGIGAIVGVAINGGVLRQITRADHLGLVAGSLLHAAGLAAAVLGGVATLRKRATA
jgi:hypothetical protein